ncbi:keratin-associated protein 19-2-like [Anopheles albimanus]|uniref:keratin-associated protein 19-2-like n=1 Tax=Anopheles albimanus TaxID=7167 RepID=UPI001640649F|nr:keratin-associated protein 19-2-like [Anopheles albimanus]
MKSLVLLFALVATSCRATSTDRDDIAGSKDSSLASFLQPIEARVRNDQIVPERRSRELSYLGTGYNYNPYATQYHPYGLQHNQYNPYNPYAGSLNGYGGVGTIGGVGGIGLGGAGGFVGGGFGGYGYPGATAGYGVGQSVYPYSNGWSAIQTPYGYGNQLGGYNRGLYI